MHFAFIQLVDHSTLFFSKSGLSHSDLEEYKEAMGPYADTWQPRYFLFFKQ